jgi:hypothetical protein
VKERVAGEYRAINQGERLIEEMAEWIKEVGQGE